MVNMNQNVLDEVSSLVRFVKEDELYQRYLRLIDKMKKNTSLMELIEMVKKVQRQAVLARERGDQALFLQQDQKEQELLSKLEEYPLYCEFREVQEELNDCFQMIKDTLDDYFFHLVND
mgnify:CR=1 FL=1